MALFLKRNLEKDLHQAVIVEIVQVKDFSKTIESYCTALSSKTKLLLKLKKVNY